MFTQHGMKVLFNLKNFIKNYDRIISDPHN